MNGFPTRFTYRIGIRYLIIQAPMAVLFLICIVDKPEELGDRARHNSRGGIHR
jgi:hypothetical protein